MEMRGRSPMRIIAENNEVSISTVYEKMDFFYSQCVKFAAAHERKLVNGDLSKYRLFVGVDRQYFTFNWKRYTNRKNTFFVAIGSADNPSGYVFGMHLNYDPDSSREDAQRDSDAIGDHIEQEPYRKYARVMLREDYKAAVKRSHEDSAKRKGLSVDEWSEEAKLSAIQAAEESYVKGSRRQNTDRLEFINADVRLPEKGLEVMPDYSILGHFYFLRHLFQNTAHQVVFFLDRDSGFRGAMMTAFNDWIRTGNCEGFFVVLSSRKTRGEIQRVFNELRREESIFRIAAPWLSDEDIHLKLAEESLKRPIVFEPYKDAYYVHPVPKKTEPEKIVCHLTDHGQFDHDQKLLAGMLVRASRWGIDNFFEYLRRRFSGFERAVTSAVQPGRKFYTFAIYNPAMAVKLLEIGRVFYNYVHVGRHSKETPAQKLGLVDRRYKVIDIINFI